MAGHCGVVAACVMARGVRPSWYCWAHGIVQGVVGNGSGMRREAYSRRLKAVCIQLSENQGARGVVHFSLRTEGGAFCRRAVTRA